MIKLTVLSLALLSLSFAAAAAEEKNMTKYQVPSEFKKYFAGIHRLNSKYPDAATRYRLIDMNQAQQSTESVAKPMCIICEGPGFFFCCPPPHHLPFQ